MTDSEYQQLVEFLSARFAEVDRRFTEIDGRFTEVDGRFTDMDGRFTEIGGRFTETDRRIDSLAARQEEQFREILAHFDELYRRLERLESEYFAIVQTLRRIETLIGSERAQREVLGQSVDQLRQQIADLQARLDAVEARLQD
jgi:chromosome segregation ATPase